MINEEYVFDNFRLQMCVLITYIANISKSSRLVVSLNQQLSII